MIQSVSRTILKIAGSTSIRNSSRNQAKNLIRMSFTNSFKSSAECNSIKLEGIHRTPDPDHLLWIDCEMTGLDLNKDKLLEIMLIITDNDLNEIDRIGPLVLKCDQESLDSMDDWCKATHAKTGLITRSLKSDLTTEKVDDLVVVKLNEHSIKGGVLAGNSISVDNLFIRKYLKKTSQLLHYRLLDVSSIKLLKERWYPEVKSYNKSLKHDALSDILESIGELKFYKQHLFK